MIDKVVNEYKSELTDFTCSMRSEVHRKYLTCMKYPNIMTKACVHYFAYLDSPSNTELHDETKFIPAMRIGPIKSVNSTDQGYRSSLTFGKKAKKPLHRSRSVTFNTESELESIFDGPHTITSRSSFIPKTQKKLKPIIK